MVEITFFLQDQLVEYEASDKCQDQKEKWNNLHQGKEKYSLDCDMASDGITWLSATLLKVPSESFAAFRKWVHFHARLQSLKTAAK